MQPLFKCFSIVRKDVTVRLRVINMRGSPMFPPNQWRSNRAYHEAIRNSRLQNSPQILPRCHNAHSMRLEVFNVHQIKYFKERVYSILVVFFDYAGVVFFV